MTTGKEEKSVKRWLYLSESQAGALEKVGMAAITLTSLREEQRDTDIKVRLQTKILSSCTDFNYQRIVERQYRVILTRPETAVGDSFHAKILRSPSVRNNIINFIVDEGHSVTVWGTDDFRPEYAQLANVSHTVYLSLQHRIQQKW